MVWVLLIVMQLKHFIADYPLQNEWMLGKFKLIGWEKHLAAHCAVHLVFTFIIAMCFGASAVLALKLGLLDFTIHFIMDRIKASPIMLGRFEALSKDQYKGLVESKTLAMSGISYPNKDLSDESKRIVKEIDNKFKSNKMFWYSLGLDQMVHHLTDLLIVYILISILGG